MKLRHASDYMFHGKTSDLAIMDERCVALYKERAENTICFFRFVKGAMNIIDLLGILPYFMSLLLNLITVSGKKFMKQDHKYFKPLFVCMKIPPPF